MLPLPVTFNCSIDVSGFESICGRKSFLCEEKHGHFNIGIAKWILYIFHCIGYAMAALMAIVFALPFSG